MGSGFWDADGTHTAKIDSSNPSRGQNPVKNFVGVATCDWFWFYW